MNPSRFRQYLSLGGILLSLYALVYAGDFVASGDEIIRCLMTDNFVQGRGFVAEYRDIHGQRKAYAGERIPRFNVLQPALAAPLRAIAALIPAGGGARYVDLGGALIDRSGLKAMLWLNPALTVSIALLFFECGLRLGYSAGAARLAALMLGLGTILFPYTANFHGEPLSGLLLLVAFRLAIGRTGKAALFSGFFAGLLASQNLAYTLSVPLLALGALWTPDWNSWRSRLALFMAGIAPGAAVLCVQNLVRGGTGYGDTPGFNTPLAVGLFGNLLSPGKSVFVFSPILLLAVAGFPALLRAHRTEARLALALILLNLVLFSKWCSWAGGTAWGPRFLLPLHPLALLGALPALKGLRRRGHLVKASVGALAALSVSVQLSATLAAPFHWYQFAAERLQVRMPENRYDSIPGRTPDPELLFQTTLPYFPEFCPPVLQTEGLISQIREARREAFPPLWIRKGRWAWPTICLAAMLGFWALGRSTANRAPIRAERG